MMALPSLWVTYGDAPARIDSPTFIIGGLFFSSDGSQTCFGQEWNPYVNFHRPSAVPEKEMAEKKKGKEKRVYRWYATPFEILRQLPDVARHLKEEVTMEELEREAGAKSDMESAREMQTAKQKLFERIWKEQSA